jgi:hypothetical protein
VRHDDDTYPIICDGHLVALAGPGRCYFLTDELTADQFRVACAMCLCSREVREGRLEGPFTPELAERWAQVYVALGG